MNAPTKSPAKRTMSFGRVDEFLIVVHNKLPPADDEWNAWMEFNLRYFHSSPQAVLRCLVVTEGGAPTATQRLVMNEKLSVHLVENPRGLRSAIVTASTFVRGVVTALSWFHPGYCAFSPERMDDAMSYLEVPDEFRTEIRTLVKSLQAQIPSGDGKPTAVKK